MNFYELVNEIDSSRTDHFDNLPYSFTQSNRDKLGECFDLEVFDLVMTTYRISIVYRSDQRKGGSDLDYRIIGDKELTPFTADELMIFDSLDWERLPHTLKAHVYDVIWLCNRDFKAATIAAEEYYKSYSDCFDAINWVQCVDYITRAVELVSKLNIRTKKHEYLTKVYNDIIKLNGEDPSFLSISLIELLINQRYQGDFTTLVPLADKLISKNENSISTTHIVEQAYYVKASLYQQLKDNKAENDVYVKYANSLMMEADKLVNAKEERVVNRNWSMAENDIEKAIGLFQNHGASEKAIEAQKKLVEVQKTLVRNMPVHRFETDVSDYCRKLNSMYENHNVHELIWDVVFTFSFQNKQEIRYDIIKGKSPICDFFQMRMRGFDGQTESLIPGLNLDDENNILLHMYHRAKENEDISGQVIGRWFISRFRKLGLQENDLSFIFEDNPIIPEGQEKDVQRGVYYGLTGHMSDALDKLAPRAESIIRNLADMCGDLMTYYDPKEGIQQKKVLSQVFSGEKLNECIEEDILFTFDGLLQQKAGSNIRNKIGHGLYNEADCFTGDCIYFVMIVLKFCALYSKSYFDEFEKRKQDNKESISCNNVIT